MVKKIRHCKKCGKVLINSGMRDGVKREYCFEHSDPYREVRYVPMSKVEKTRAYKSGEAMGNALKEMVNLMYQKDTARKFWKGLKDSVKDK